MIILFAPAKTLKPARALSQSAHFPYEDKTIEIVRHIQSLTPAELRVGLHLSTHQVETIHHMYQNFEVSASYHAFDLLDGVAYKALNYSMLDAKERDFLDKRVYVIDALYGLYQPRTPIKPYYLDMGFKSLNLPKIWRPVIQNWIRQMIEQNIEILSLTSSEYSRLIPSNLPIYEISFLEEKEGFLKANSVFSKQMRGKLLRHIAQFYINSIEQLPSFFEGYHLEKVGYKLFYKRYLR